MPSGSSSGAPLARRRVQAKTRELRVEPHFKRVEVPCKNITESPGTRAGAEVGDERRRSKVVASNENHLVRRTRPLG